MTGQEIGGRVDTITRQELVDTLAETGQAHHRAYQESDGVDPEWASWYGPYLHTRIGDGLGRSVTRSELIYLLVKAQRAHDASGGETPWPEAYADAILAGE